MTALRPVPFGTAAVAAFSAMVSVTFFSVNDMAIKFLSGGYALHEVVLIRSVVALGVLFALIAPGAGGLRIVRTRRPLLHIVRGLLVVTSNMLFFLGLAALPLAEAVAIFFICPVIVTLFSVIFLRETVGPHRWAATAVGFIGVLVMIRPGTAAFQPASLLPMGSAVAYSAMHMLTRTIGRTDGAATLSFYIQLTFLIVCIGFGVTVGDGHFAAQDNASLAFLLRAWTWPGQADYLILAAIGLCSAMGGYFISKAYRMAEAAFVAPFEYLSLVLAIFWGLLVFGEWPDAVAFVGIGLIIASGLYTLWRESRARPAPVAEAPQLQR
ncbi:MAG: EamA family transporter [Limimaricola sp.]|uniref:DMT family transporter n=1 Tax=Limimaricola sp. TaxID=2211665 RepID=UPI001D4137AB|nr:DMT family transporter [Limimaricola sp.]MBI1418740.1 EamA family transporter [Limimaricola sp.]